MNVESDNETERLRLRLQELETVVAEQVADLKKKNREFEEQYRARNEFIAMVSHEVRTPLVAIKEGIEIVLSGEIGEISAEQRKFLAISKSNVERLRHFVDGVLDFSRLEAKKMSISLRPGNLAETLADAIEDERQKANSKGLYLNFKFRPGMPGLCFAPDRITQVMGNLLANAIGFTSKGGVTVALQEDVQGQSMRVCVEDTGIGIAQERIPGLFQEYPEKRGSKDMQTGIGLMICKEIIEGHGGRIWAESKKGKGSRFYFSLPVKKT